MEAAVIKSKELEEDFKEALKERDERVYIFYLVSSLTGFRQGDILPLRVRNIRGKTHLALTERKTGQFREVPIPTELRKEINRYTKGKHDRDPLIPTKRVKKKKKVSSDPFHLDYTTIYKIMRSVGEEVGIENVSTHTGRKVYGYKIFKKTGRIADAQLMLGHKDPEHTMRYIGADDDYKDNLAKSVFG